MEQGQATPKVKHSEMDYKKICEELSKENLQLRTENQRLQNNISLLNEYVQLFNLSNDFLIQVESIVKLYSTSLNTISFIKNKKGE